MTDIELLLMKLGITANYNGYWYLCSILEMLCTQNLWEMRITKDIYPYAAQMHATSPWNVDRGIRTAVDVCWKRGNREMLCRICSCSQKPSNYTFIAALATYIKMHRARCAAVEAQNSQSSTLC